MLLYRRLRYGYTFRRIRLTQGKYTIVDTEDYEELSQYKWNLNRCRRSNYAVRCIWDKSTKKTKSIKMHRLIMKIDSKLFVDHINGDGLDNRKANLRAVTAMQNSWNMKKSRRKKRSRYKGVTWNKQQKRWIVSIQANGKSRYIGTFKNEAEAGKAYDRAAKKYHGEFARLNFPESGERSQKKQLFSRFFWV